MASGSDGNPFRVLRHRAFATFWFAAVVSDLGTWLQAVAVGTMVARVTGKASSTGIVAIAAFLPQALVIPLGGVVADRFDRRRIVIAVLGAQTAITVALGFVLRSGTLSVSRISGLIALQGIAGSFSQPASQAMMPDLVPKHELQKAVSLGTVSWNSGRIIGAALAGALGVWLSTPGIVFVNAATFAVLMLAVGSLRGSYRATGAVRSSFVRELAAGWRSLVATPGCRFGVVALMIVQTFIGPFVGLIPIVARKVHHGGRSLTSALTVGQGVGALLAAVAAGYVISAVGRPRTIAFFTGTACLALAGYAHAPTGTWAVVLVVLLGFGILGSFVTLTGIVQRDAPVATRARVLSIQAATTGICYSTGVLVSGALGDRHGLPLVLTIDAAIAAVFLVLGLTVWRHSWAVAGRGDPMSRRWERRVVAEAAAATVRPMP